MAATAAQIAELRRKIAEPTSDPYTDAILTTYIERYPMIDERGELPYTFEIFTSLVEPPERDINEVWIPTYDLNMAAACVWEEKAAGRSDQFDYSTTVSASRSQFMVRQKFENAIQQARYYRSRRSAKTIELVVSPIVPPRMESNAD